MKTYLTLFIATVCLLSPSKLTAQSKQLIDGFINEKLKPAQSIEFAVSSMNNFDTILEKIAVRKFDQNKKIDLEQLQKAPTSE
ncbi:MAG: hypothetical protein ABGY95_06450 [Rubritalea sp.]|uniref:hypothetical protein n=1 Tax=Rubritalea sp. TaxID=2109375 RepID=UPI003242E1A3